MLPLDCTATAIGLLMPSLKNAALVVPINVPFDVYRTRAKSSSPGTPFPSAVTTAILPLDCSMAVSGLTLTPPKFVVTVPPVPKAGSKLPAWACAKLTPNVSPSANSPAIESNLHLFIVYSLSYLVDSPAKYLVCSITPYSGRSALIRPHKRRSVRRVVSESLHHGCLNP